MQMVVCDVKLYVHAPSHFIYQFPITGQSCALWQGRPIHRVELLQESDGDIGNLRKRELLSDANSRAGVEGEVVESEFAPVPSFWVEAVGIRAPEFGVGVDGPKLHGRDVSAVDRFEAE